MQKTKYWISAIIGCSIVVIGWFHYAKTPPLALSPIPAITTSSSTNPTASSTNTVPVKQVVNSGPFPINTSDNITSWNFKGTYMGNDSLIAKANADIAHLTALMGKGEYDDYDLYLGIGNDKSLQGDGKSAYENYNHSIAIHPSKGLAYANMGNLMDLLGAYHTAADAYTRAIVVEPKMLEYHIERLNFLTRQFPADNTRIIAAFADTYTTFGDVAPILSIQAQWLSGQKRYADAIKVWETVKTLSPGKDMTAIDTEIARLKAKI